MPNTPLTKTQKRRLLRKKAKQRQQQQAQTQQQPQYQQRQQQNKPRMPRTPQSRTNGLSLNKSFKRMTVSNPVNDYMMCRISPFNHTGKSFLPDGSAVRRVTKEIRLAYDITIGSSGGVAMIALPELPRGIMFKDIAASPTTGVIVNGTSLTGTRQGNALKGGWYSPIIPEWATWANTNPSNEQVTNPWAAAKVRFITHAVRIIYTGTALAGSGTITMQPAEMGVAESPSPNLGIITSWSAAGTADPVTFAVGTVQHEPVDVAYTNTTYTPQSVIVQAVRGAYFVLPRNTNAVTWRDSQTAFILTDGKTDSLFNYVGSANYASSAVYDTAFSPIQAVISGAQPNSTFRVEIQLCVEFQPTTLSPFKDYATIPQHNDKTTAIAEVEAKLAKAPIGGDLTWTDRIVDFVQSAGRIGKAIASVLL